MTITLKKKPFQNILKYIKRQKIHYYIKHVSAKGLLCIKEIGTEGDFMQSAQEVFGNKKLFTHFDSNDAAYIKEVALFERSEARIEA